MDSPHRVSGRSGPVKRKRSYYRSVRLPKGDGSFRLISAPCRALEAAQRAILAVLEPLAKVSPACHGFTSGKSIVTNARPHVGKAVVIRVDISGFFHSIGSRRVEGIIASLGIERGKAKEWSITCTQSVEGKGRVLPQGAPTSPLLSNLACSDLDLSLSRISSHMGFSFTRYADDITLSGDNLKLWPNLLGLTKSCVEAHGFTVKKEKTMVMLAHCKQVIAGVVVNSKTNVTRVKRKNVRAALHQCNDTPQTLGMVSHIQHVRGSK